MDIRYGGAQMKYETKIDTFYQKLIFYPIFRLDKGLVKPRSDSKS